MNFKNFKHELKRVLALSESEDLKPYKFTVDYDDGRPETIIEYGIDVEDAKQNLFKSHKYLQEKPERVSDGELVPEDHEEVTEDFTMIHQSSEGPDQSGSVTFFPTAFGYEYKSTVEDFNGKGPQWTTIRTIDGIRNWFRNVLFQFGAKDVYIGDHHWNIDDFPKNEALDEEFYIGNEKYLIIPVSYASKDIRILDKRNGEFIKDSNGENLKFATEEECKDYIENELVKNESIEDYDDPQGQITLRDAKEQFEKLVRRAHEPMYQGYRFIDTTLLGVHCPAFNAINEEDIPEIIRSWGYVVVEDGYDPAIALGKEYTVDDVRQMIRDFNKENGLDESLNEDLEYGVEYRNMRNGIHNLIVTDSREDAEKILSYLTELENLDTTIYDEDEVEHQINFIWDEINRLANTSFEVNYHDTEASNGIYDGIEIINYADVKPDIYESLNECNECKLAMMNRLDRIAKGCKDVEIRQRAVSLLDDAGLGVDVKDEAEKLFKEVDKLDESLNEKDIENDDAELFTYHALVVINKGAEYTESVEDFKEALNDSLKEFFTSIGVDYIIDNIDIIDEENTLEAEIDLSVSDKSLSTTNLKSALYYDGIYNWDAKDFEQVILKLNESLNEENIGNPYTVQELNSDAKYIIGVLNKGLELLSKEDEDFDRITMNMLGAAEDLVAFLQDFRKDMEELKNANFEESVNEERDLNAIWANELYVEPIIETAEGPIYLQVSEDGKSIEYGSITNAGMIVEGSIEYDFDYTLDQNLEYIADEIFDKYGIPMEDGSEPYSDSKYDRLGDLFDESCKNKKKKEEKEKKEKVEEEFKDTMINPPEAVVTDVQELDMPQSLANTISTDENGEILTTEKVVDNIDNKLDSVADAIVSKLDDIAQKIDNVEKESEVVEVKDEVENEIVPVEEEPEEENEEEVVEDENEEIEESYKKYLVKSKYEDLNKIKKEIDDAKAQGKTAEDIKNIIDISSEDDNEKEEAEKYAIDALTEKLLSTSKNCKLKDIIKK